MYARGMRTARFSSSRAATRAASNIRAIKGVSGSAVRVGMKDGWATVVVPAEVIDTHPEVYELIWAEGGLPDWPRPRSARED
jgi:hypothetical protein